MVDFAIALEFELKLRFSYTWKLEKRTKLEFQVLTSNLLLSSWGVLRFPKVFGPSPSSYTKRSTRKNLLKMNIYIHMWFQALIFYLVKPPKKDKQDFFIKDYILLHSERIIKVGFPNIKLIIFMKAIIFICFLALTINLNQN